MARMETIKIELSDEDRELLKRVADALERAYPDKSGSFGDRRLVEGDAEERFRAGQPLNTVDRDDPNVTYTFIPTDTFDTNKGFQERGER